MNPAFDIERDELAVLLAEANDQLQTLDEGLVRLEREGTDPQLLQAIFRAAHTLKGEAGIINHWRMADLTHALETVLDGLRKGLVTVSPELVDSGLEALDALKQMRDELLAPDPNPVDIAPLVKQLLEFTSTKSEPSRPTPTFHRTEDMAPGLFICADIAPDSLTPAARAFQVMLTLQGLGDVYDLQPPQAVIESAAPVRRVTARLVTAIAPAQVRRALGLLSEITRLVIGDEEINLAATETLARPAEISPPPASPSVTVASPASADAPTQRLTDKTVRTSVERLDNLMNLVGELITDRNRLTQIHTDLERRFNGHDQALAENLAQTVVHLGRLTDQLQDEVMRIRLVPVANVFNKFPRLVRDLARKADKHIDLVLHGEDTELDRSVIEEISDPLIHLLRNAVSHGIESPSARLASGKTERGTIRLTARHEESRIILTVEDDGRGIDVERVSATAVSRGLLTAAEAAALTPEEAIDLIFRPGLSTAEAVDDVSGRGVGMDIVRTNIERLNGNILVATWPGQGTRFEIILPLTLATISTLLVKLAGPDSAARIFAIPLTLVMETLRLSAQAIHTIKGHAVTQVRGRVLPLVRLSEALGLPVVEGHYRGTHEYVVAVRWNMLEMGLLVDTLVGEQELVIKSLGALMGETPGISGAAILGDGQVTLIVDVPGLFKVVT